MKNHIKYSKGICWIGDCRIPFVDSDKDTINFDRPRLREKKEWVYGLGTTWENPDVKEYNTQGRFTPNLLVCDDMLNDGIKPNKGHRAKGKVSGYGEFGGGKSEYHGIGEYMEVDSKSRYYDLDMWFNKMIESL
jgi:hypothetical protein